MAFEKVVLCSGHMIDAPGRVTPRFPDSKAESVRAEITRQLEQWKTGDKDLAICAGASGADILFAEECLKRGTALRLLLAQKREDFVRDSVQPAGRQWVERFHLLGQKAQVSTLPAAPRPEEDDLSIYERTNLWLIETARNEVAKGAKLYALLVWDEKRTGDGPGGTSDVAERVRAEDGTVAIINPTALQEKK